MNRLILFLFIPFLSFAGPLTNDREGESSFYSTDRVFKVKENLRQEYVNTLKYTTDLKGRICATEVFETVNSFFGEVPVSKKLIKNAFIYARYNNAIDDIVFRNLLHILKNSSNSEIHVTTKKDEETKLSEAQVAAYERNNRKFPVGTGPCLADRWISIYKGLKQDFPKRKKLGNIKLKKLNKRAFTSGIIDEEMYLDLEKARILKLHELDLTLTNYISKKKSLRDQFVIKNSDLSNVATRKSYRDKKKTLRMELYDDFDFMQISLMAKLIDRMRKRLNSTDISIYINYDPNDPNPLPPEIINLEPMEKYRFILKLFRKELSDLNQMSFFQNKKATYLDVLMAAYETGIVPVEEMAELEKLDIIWNPQKTKFEKIIFWVKNFGAIGAILLPPPYGFVAVLAISIIESVNQVKKSEKDKNKEKDYSLF